MNKNLNENTKLKVLIQVHGGIADVIANSNEIEVFLIDYEFTSQKAYFSYSEIILYHFVK